MFINILLQIPPASYFSLFTAIVTLISTLSGVYFTNKNHEKRLILQLNHDKVEKQKELKREKLEKLYTLCSQYELILQNKFLHWSIHIEGNIEPQEIEKLENKTGYQLLTSREIEMLINLYFSDLKEQYENLSKEILEANHLLTTYIYQYPSVNGKDLNINLLEAQKKLFKTLESIKTSIIKLSRDYC